RMMRSHLGKIYSVYSALSFRDLWYPKNYSRKVKMMKKMKSIGIKTGKKYMVRWVLGVLVLILSLMHDSTSVYSQSRKPLDIARHYAANGQSDSALLA